MINVWFPCVFFILCMSIKENERDTIFVSVKIFVAIFTCCCWYVEGVVNLIWCMLILIMCNITNIATLMGCCCCSGCCCGTKMQFPSHPRSFPYHPFQEWQFVVAKSSTIQNHKFDTFHLIYYLSLTYIYFYICLL